MMETSILKQITKFLQDKKEHKRWLAVFLCLAVIVGFGTVAALRLIGQAMTHKERVLVCGLNLHEHTVECYDLEGKLSCGYADYVVHKHNDDCYNQKGELVCTLPEIEEHEHTQECYEEQKVLACGLEESDGHGHTEECYAREQGELQCQLPEHLHEETCYDETGAVVCGIEEHQHTEECYLWNDVLVCQEAEGGHTHTEECYKTELVKTCEKPEVKLHIHTDECYEVIEETKDGGGADGGTDEVKQKLICGQIQVEEHIHAEEFNCFKIIEPNDVKEDAGETDDGIFTTDLDGKEDTEEADTAKADGAGEPEDGSVGTEEGALDGTDGFGKVKSYTGDSYKVTAIYDDRAKIPEEAELIAEQITAESDKEHYEEREAQYRESTGDKNATMKGLFKIGFYVDGEEIEPESEVKLTIQFLDENGLPEGAPITVVHFADKGTEVLDGSEAEEGSTTFNIGSFSEIAIGYGADVKTSVHISESYEYSDEAFHVVFHVEGTAELLDGGTEDSESGDSEEGEMISLPVQGKTEEEEQQPGEEETEGSAQTLHPSQAETAVEAQILEAQAAQAAEGGDGQPVQMSQDSREAAVEAIEAGAVNAPERDMDREKLEFRLQRLDKDSEIYQAVVDDVEKTNDGSELLFVQAMSYAMYYDGAELDLSRCKVTAEVEAAESLSEKIEKSVPEAISYLRAAEGEAPEEAETAEEAQLQTEVSIEVVSVAADKENPGNAEVEKIDGKILSESNPNEVMQFAAPQVFAARATGQPNPHFKVQYYANLDVMATEGKTQNALPVIDTSGGRLPENGRGEKDSNKQDIPPNDNPIKHLYVDDSGKVLTTQALTKVYEPRAYEYKKAPTINYMNALLGKPNYTLKEVWVPKHVHSKEDRYDENGALIQSACYDENGALTCTAVNPDSMDPNDWDVHPYLKCSREDHEHESGCYLHFTNRELSAGDDYVLISNDTIIRLVYDTTDAAPDFKASFYDYDIGDGKIYATENDARNKQNGQSTSKQGTDKKWYEHTKESGINSKENYKGDGAKLAFGNSNTGTGLQHEMWDGNLLNKLNAEREGFPIVAGSYKGCTFGLAAGLSEDGKIRYAEGVNAPNLFNDGSADGKTPYENDEYSLKFIRSGDTYTLSKVNNTKTDELESFKHPGKHSIWTNNFWPMDSAPSYGTDGHDMKAGKSSEQDNRKFVGAKGADVNIKGGNNKAGGTGSFPPNDDGTDHNSYFGMQYSVGFELSDDYAGPLEYYFFGDDDMWVFLSRIEEDPATGSVKYLDSQLVCDIGGTHSSVGEYINLWDYMKQEHTHGEECYGKNGNLICERTQENKAGKWALTFFYTERGASGSTCWMQFTLPSASSLTPETTPADYGDLRIEKTVTQISGEDESAVDNHDEFSFQIHFTNEKGTNLADDYSYIKYDKDGNEIGSDLIIWDGGEFTLKNGEYIVVKFLPQGSKYVVTESDKAITVTDNTAEDSKIEYITDIHTEKKIKTPEGEITKEGPKKEDLSTDKGIDGSIPSDGEDIVKYNNKYYVYELPKTGGNGTMKYTMAGALVMIFGAGFVYKRKVRERRVQVSSGN